MSLLIALFLIIIVLCRVGNEKAQDVAYEQNKREHKNKASEWEALYVDEWLEGLLKHAIDDERNYEAVRKEVFNTLPQTKHWGYLKYIDFPRYKSDVALDIMLANRGKISSSAARRGYEAYIGSGDLSKKEANFEYAKVILDLMQSRGAPVKLYYRGGTHQGRYVWEGSYEGLRNPQSHETILNFDRTSIFKENPIPPIK